MSKHLTEKRSYAISLINLPKLCSIISYCSLIEIPTQSIDHNWLSVFQFVTYNSSLMNEPLKNQIAELKYLTHLNESKPQVKQYLQFFNQSIYIKAIQNYFTAFTKAINKKVFYNKKENLLLIGELLEFLPFFYDNSKLAFIDDSVLLFLFGLNANSKKFEKKQLQLYDNYFSQSRFHSFNPNGLINNYSFTTIINSTQPKNVNKKINKSVPIPIAIANMNLKDKAIESLALNYLIPICNKRYAQHLQHAKFYACSYYQSKEFSLRKIGSYTLGLNKLNSSLDLLIEPLNTKSSIQSYSDITLFLDKQTIYNQSFTFLSQSSNCFSKKILLFNSKDTRTNENRIVKVFIYNERYKVINQIFKSFFVKGNVFSKLYVFFNDLLCLGNGLQLALLIYAFFICRYKLYAKEQKYYSYRCLMHKGDNIFVLKSKSYFNLEIGSKDFVKACNDDIDTLIPAFLLFYIRVFAKGDKRDLVKRKNYLFSIEKVVKYLHKNKNEEYWEKMVGIYQLIVA